MCQALLWALGLHQVNQTNALAPLKLPQGQARVSWGNSRRESWVGVRVNCWTEMAISEKKSQKDVR